jgi:hypothetical protein
VIVNITNSYLVEGKLIFLANLEPRNVVCEKTVEFSVLFYQEHESREVIR